MSCSRNRLIVPGVALSRADVTYPAVAKIKSPAERHVLLYFGDHMS